MTSERTTKQDCPEREKCLREYGSNLEWACKHCPQDLDNTVNELKIKISIEGHLKLKEFSCGMPEFF